VTVASGNERKSVLLLLLKPEGRKEKCFVWKTTKKMNSEMLILFFLIQAIQLSLIQVSHISKRNWKNGG
jgi:hypothetical protein